MVNKNAIMLNWRRAAGDILLIVVGVSIALAADSWLADKAERARTDRLLDSLKIEWATELERMVVYFEKVWVNGQLVFEGGEVTGKRPGKPIRRQK